jgi:hypothetical protein
MMNQWVVVTGLLIAATVMATAQTGATRSRPGGDAGAISRTPWGDPDLQGEWTSEGEYGVPFERPPQFGTRQFLTDEEYARRLEDVRVRDEGDLARVDVLSGKVDAPSAPIPHWREYNTTSRRTSYVIDPPDGRLPPRTAQARPFPVPQQCGSPARRAVRLVRGLRPRRPLLSAARSLERAAGEGRSIRSSQQER